jgi:uncharacterized protein (DUF849 family)
VEKRTVEKLIITNCATDCSMYPEWVDRFHRSDALAQSVEAAWRAGASIAHIHAPPGDYAAWAAHTQAIRDRCGISIQYGISIQTIEQRRAVIGNTMAVMTGGHVRVETEDEPYLSPPVPGDNAEHVVRIAAIPAHFGRAVATVDEAGGLLGISR